jgi:hypothetical protein
MKRIYFGSIGSDAGYWYIGPDGKIHHVPGWNPEAFLSMERTVEIIGLAARLQTPDAKERILSASFGQLQEDLKGFIEPGSIIVLNQQRSL